MKRFQSILSGLVLATIALSASAVQVPQTTVTANGALFKVVRVQNSKETAVSDQTNFIKAQEAATNESIKCKCTTRIYQPTFSVSIKYIEVSDSGSPTTTPTYKLVFKWTLPTKREDNTALAATDLKEVQLFYKESNQATATSIVVPTTLTTYTTPALPKGSYTAYLVAVDKDGLKSKNSTSASITI